MIQDHQIAIDSLQLHFFLCIERSGSTLLASIFNSHPEVISPIEELFIDYNYRKYKKTTKWTKERIEMFVEDFITLSTENAIHLYPEKTKLVDSLYACCEGKRIDYLEFCKLVYLQGIPGKKEQGVKYIVDKQIKLIYRWRKLVKISPNSKYVVLMRNPVDNVVSRINRKMGFSLTAPYLGKIYEMHYDNAFQLQRAYPNKVKFIYYEELVSDTAKVIKSVCEFLSIPFNPNMLDYRENVQEVLDQKTKAHPSGMERINQRQSKLTGPINKENVNIGQSVLTQHESDLILQINKDVWSRDLPSTKIIPTMKERFEILQATMMKQIVFSTYLASPLICKKSLRKLKLFVRRQISSRKSS